MWPIITMVCCILMWVSSIVRPHCTVSVAQEGCWPGSVHPPHQWDCTAVHSCELLWYLQQHSCFCFLYLLLSFSYACKLLVWKELQPYILSCILIIVLYIQECHKSYPKRRNVHWGSLLVDYNCSALQTELFGFWTFCTVSC